MTRPGQIIDDRYRLTERIAAGGVGQVWLATDLLLERPVAVKVLRPEYADHPATLARFRKEARHAGALSHPCVAQVFDYGHAGPGGPPYLVMEFIDGPSLADLLAVDPVEPAFALDVIAQVASGLDAAHEIGLVHRDIKPGNILIGPDGRVKITDFGIAYAAGQTPVTGPGLVMGTTQYMAPERISGGGAGTPASDLYALGIVLHECLTGVPPYEGTPAEVMAGHLYVPLPPLPASASPELDSLIARLTAKDPARRIGNAGDLAVLAARIRDALATRQPARDGALIGAGMGHAERPGAVPGSLLSGGPVRNPRRAVALAAGVTLLAAMGVAGLVASGVLTAAHSAYRAPGKSSSSPSAPATGAVPSAAGGGFVSGSTARTGPSATVSVTERAPGHGGKAHGGSAPSPSPATGTSPTAGGSARRAASFRRCRSRSRSPRSCSKRTRPAPHR